MILVWTRDEGARDALALALARFDYPFRLVASGAPVHEVLAQAGGEVRALVLGPSFTRAEAELIRREVPPSVGLVLLEDHLDPLPPELAEGAPGARVLIPVRARSLLNAIERAT